jgi:hypothetical protein
MNPAATARLEAALTDAGAPPGSVVWAAAPDQPGARRPPEGPWLVVPWGEQIVVGALGRGKFATYEALWNAEDAIDLAVRLAANALETRQSPAGEGEAEVGRRTGSAIVARTSQRGGAPGPNGLTPGDALDCFGVETGHHLYALGTPFPWRSQPPSDVGAPYLTFEVAEPLPPTVNEGVAAPWFEQPGGGAMVVLDRPIRWYVDNGFLTVRT